MYLLIRTQDTDKAQKPIIGKRRRTAKIFGYALNFTALCDTIYITMRLLHTSGKMEEKMEPHDYKVTKIEGEYATLTDLASGDEIFIALFLLPEGTDIGMTLHYENLSYEITEE